MLQNHHQPATKRQPAALLVLRWPWSLVLPKAREEIIPSTNEAQNRSKQTSLGPQSRAVLALTLPLYFRAPQEVLQDRRGRTVCSDPVGWPAPKGSSFWAPWLGRFGLFPMEGYLRHQEIPVPPSPSHPSGRDWALPWIVLEQVQPIVVVCKGFLKFLCAETSP